MSGLTKTAIALLSELIAIPSFSKEEDKTADCIAEFLHRNTIEVQRNGNNVWAKNKNFDPALPTYLLNSHHDTVRPNSAYSRDPFAPTIEYNRIYGLGSNDAGGCLVSLIMAFISNYHAVLPFNLILACSAEEEISGKNGIESLLPILPPLHGAIVGEPTFLKAAVAEKGLMVVDGVAIGKPGHAAREEGINAITLAMQDLQWLQNYDFQKVSSFLGPTKATATIIQAGSQHNVIPDSCTFTLDIRINECYSHEEVLTILRKGMAAELTPRSTRLKPSFLPDHHPFDLALKTMEITQFGSSTMSDQALLSCPSVKIGPGDSARSHSADEWIGLEEIEKGIACYQALLQKLTALKYK